MRKLEDVPGVFTRLELVAGPFIGAEKVVLKAEVSIPAELKGFDDAVDVGVNAGAGMENDARVGNAWLVIVVDCESCSDAWLVEMESVVSVDAWNASGGEPIASSRVVNSIIDVSLSAVSLGNLWNPFCCAIEGGRPVARNMSIFFWSRKLPSSAWEKVGEKALCCESLANGDPGMKGEGEASESVGSDVAKL